MCLTFIIVELSFQDFCGNADIGKYKSTFLLASTLVLGIIQQSLSIQLRHCRHDPLAFWTGKPMMRIKNCRILGASLRRTPATRMLLDGFQAQQEALRRKIKKQIIGQVFSIEQGPWAA